MHDDLWDVTDDKGRQRHEFIADATNELRLTDISERRTGEGTLHPCAIKDRLLQPERRLLHGPTA